MDERLPREHAGVVQQKLRRHVVGGVDHEVVAVDQGLDVGRIEPLGPRLDLERGMEGAERFAGDFGLRTTDVARTVQQLSV